MRTISYPALGTPDKTAAYRFGCGERTGVQTEGDGVVAYSCGVLQSLAAQQVRSSSLAPGQTLHQGPYNHTPSREHAGVSRLRSYQTRHCEDGYLDDGCREVEGEKGGSCHLVSQETWYTAQSGKL